MAILCPHCGCELAYISDICPVCMPGCSEPEERPAVDLQAVQDDRVWQLADLIDSALASIRQLVSEDKLSEAVDVASRAEWLTAEIRGCVGHEHAIRLER